MTLYFSYLTTCHNYRLHTCIAIAPNVLFFVQVNAYNSVRVVHALYHSKYFLPPLVGFDKGHQPSSLTKSVQRSGDCYMSNYAEKLDSTGAKSKVERNTSIDDVHKVTILNFPEDDLEPSNENQIYNMNEGCSQGKVGSQGVNYENERLKFPSVEVYTTMDQWRWDHQQHRLQVTSTTCSWNRDAKSRDIRGRYHKSNRCLERTEL
ncbi:putative B-block-binding subunit of tfiiic protein [Quillaja saponaria]|uniref:B-block-binding subunit of tfiiic protein n=1 Tax=Quillaja saponaria TaxID=32244 RepID=A0AAD7LSA8_QUISA|nr:putative B-block-binding subunit of tfiiic protein [Quillaja saponaria]